MNRLDPDAQARLQVQAALAEQQNLPAGRDAQVDQYRLVIRALRQPLREHLPPDFAARMAARVQLSEDGSSIEDWMVTALLLTMAIIGLVYVQPVMAAVIGRLHFKLPTLPWPLLVAAAVSVVLAWVVDRSASAWRGSGHRA